MTLSMTQKIVRYAAATCEDHRDDSGEVNLTNLGEAVMEHFNLTGEEYDEEDYAFAIFKELEQLRLLD